MKPSPRKLFNAPMPRKLNYATSPLLASKTPPWRSRLLVFLLGVGSCVLVGRAAYIQVYGSEFYQEQGEKRYAHTLVVPASRGRITDRAGALLATSVPSPSIWVNPKEFSADVAQRRALLRLVELRPDELEQRLASSNYFAWLKRQADESLWQQVHALKLKGVYAMHDYRRKYPEGEAAAHVVGFTNTEDQGLEGIELAHQKALQGHNGSRRVIKDRPGRVIDELGEQIDPVNGSDVQLSLDAKVQFFAYQRLRDAVLEHGAKAGSVVVLDVQSGEVLALANTPATRPARA